MALQSSGAISFRELQQEYGGPANSNEGSISLSQYYAGASGNGTTTAKVSTSPAYSESLGAEINFNTTSNNLTGDLSDANGTFYITQANGAVYKLGRWINVASTYKPPYVTYATNTFTHSSVTDSNKRIWDQADGWYFLGSSAWRAVQSNPFIIIVTLIASGTGNTNVEVNLSGGILGSVDTNSTTIYNSENTGNVVTGLSLSDGQTYTINFFEDDGLSNSYSRWTNSSGYLYVKNFQGTCKARHVSFTGLRIQPTSSYDGTVIQKPMLKQSRSSGSGAYTYGTRFGGQYFNQLGENDLDTNPGTLTTDDFFTTYHIIGHMPLKSHLPHGSGVDLYDTYETYMPDTSIAKAQAGEDGGFLKWGSTHSVPSSGAVSMSNHYGGFQVAPVPKLTLPDGKQHGITLTQNGVATATATAVIV